jgi:hypothetical protein
LSFEDWQWLAPACSYGSPRSGGRFSFRKDFNCPQLWPWEGPFAHPTQRLPQHPAVAAERREEKRRYPLWREMHKREAEMVAHTIWLSAPQWRIAWHAMLHASAIQAGRSATV